MIYLLLMVIVGGFWVASCTRASTTSFAKSLNLGNSSTSWDCVDSHGMVL